MGELWEHTARWYCHLWLVICPHSSLGSSRYSRRCLAGLPNRYGPNTVLGTSGSTQQRNVFHTRMAPESFQLLSRWHLASPTYIWVWDQSRNTFTFHLAFRPHNPTIKSRTAQWKTPEQNWTHREMIPQNEAASFSFASSSWFQSSRIASMSGLYRSHPANTSGLIYSQTFTPLQMKWQEWQ
jgi:hypothetical protein